MSIENARDFYQRMTADEAFRTQLRNAASEERTAIVQKAGYNFTPEEWEAATAQTAETDVELKEAELEAIAGGVMMAPLYGGGLPPGLLWPPKSSNPLKSILD